ncbi:LacI family DNA-binding transcriptional regulator [Amycolatopsis sp. CA-126428]|uniref:LacI family DNA-binding transcriptional regulator n=1 Tax=Amycolatopsis sp. CA-126428 TaxID=2073158 RepID=UPI001E3B6D89|nr:LacI family DNA-binding transcriptional regulator [Amycolatopsis sp. CA-126428]
MADHSTKTMPTLAVIAREAGVSVPTVSRVVNGREEVAAGTRQKVTEVLLRRGYVRRRSDTKHNPRESPLVDVILRGLRNSYASELLSGIEQRAHAAGLDIVVSAMEGCEEREPPSRGWLDKLARRGSAGVLLVFDEPTRLQSNWLADHEVAVVVIDPVRPLVRALPSVGSTNRAGGFSAAEHLIEQGHRRIGVIAGPSARLYATARIEGARAAIEATGGRLTSAYVRHGEPNQAGGYSGMCQLLALEDPPTAVFCCSDTMALGACELLRERGISVPDGMSVVGFDDTPECSWLRPALTSVRQPIVEMGAAGFDMLAGLIAGERPRAARLELPTTLIVRHSTGRPRS